MSSPQDPEARIITYDEKYLSVFTELNREWIEEYFTLEPMDLVQLKNPQESILDPGGEIFFFIENDQAVGTCAMVPHGAHSYELAKMAVAKDSRGKGIGIALVNAVLDWAKASGANEVTILSNTILEPAISLYLKTGFRIVSLGPHPDYQRCNIAMRIQL